MRPFLRSAKTPVPKSARRTSAEVVSQASALVEELRHPRRRPTTIPPPVAPGPITDFSSAEADGTLGQAEQTLARRIRAHLPKGALSVTLTDNRHTMISVRRDQRREPRYQVRLHHMFADADTSVTRALARYIGRNDSDASRVLSAFIDHHHERVRCRGRAPKLVLETRGRFHDLQAIYDDLNGRYFDGTIDARITWGQRSARPRRRNSIKMGSYSVEERLIRVHRSLDRSFVPQYFVEWIVFHEMLHQVHKATWSGGRRLFHTPAFYADESTFEHYERARRWERAHLDQLLTF